MTRRFSAAASAAVDLYADEGPVRNRPRPPRPGCATPGKESFGTRNAAANAARSYRDAGLTDRPLGTYRCGCGRWHVTHQVRYPSTFSVVA